MPPNAGRPSERNGDARACEPVDDVVCVGGAEDDDAGEAVARAHDLEPEPIEPVGHEPDERLDTREPSGKLEQRLEAGRERGRGHVRAGAARLKPARRPREAEIVHGRALRALEVGRPASGWRLEGEVSAPPRVTLCEDPAPHVQEAEPERAAQPLVTADGEDVDRRLAHVERKRPDVLRTVHDQPQPMLAAQRRERRQVDERSGHFLHRADDDRTRAAVDRRLELVDLGPARPVRHEPEAGPAPGQHRPEELDVAREHVFARRECEQVGCRVQALLRRLDERDLAFVGSDESGRSAARAGHMLEYDDRLVGHRRQRRLADETAELLDRGNGPGRRDALAGRVQIGLRQRRGIAGADGGPVSFRWRQPDSSAASGSPRDGRRL